MARQLSTDGVWEWNGVGWVKPPRVQLPCPLCSVATTVASHRSDYVCVSCHRKHIFGRCSSCDYYFQRPSEERRRGTPCPNCAGKVWWITAWDWLKGFRSQELLPAWVTQDPDRRTVADFSLAAAGGTTLPVGSACRLDFAADGVSISATTGQQEHLSYEQIVTLQVTGSTTTTSAGVIGGGFGVVGAAEGMLAASVINSLTRTTRTYCVIRLAATTAEYVFSSTTVEANALNMKLTPVQLRIRQASSARENGQRTHTAAPPASMADELQKLASLRDSGILSDSEFATAKARLLGAR